VEEASIRDVTALMPKLLALALLGSSVSSWRWVEDGVIEAGKSKLLDCCV
jgi:hypothetical protein